MVPINLQHIPVALVVFPLVFGLIYSVWAYDKRYKFLPPGPRGLPLLGNITAFADPEKFWQTALKWKKQYGDLVYVKVGTTRMVFLNSPQAVKDLMDKRGSIYSSRPYQPMFFDAYSNKRRYFFMPYGLLWRSIRKVSHAALNLTTSSSYTPVQDFESKQTMYDLLHAKDDWEFFNLSRRYSTSVIMTMGYGIRIPSFSHPTVASLQKINKNFFEMATPGKWLVDSFPQLAKLPPWMVQNWWKKGRAAHDSDLEFYLGLYRTLTKQIEEGKAPDCFVKDFVLAEPEKHGVDEETAAYTAGSLVEAGAESTSGAFNTFLLACVLYPDVAKAAQEELDRVIGPDRLPTFEDEPQLPYIRAMIKETLRWKPILKVGAPHSTTEDDWYNGYFIPKNTTVILSWWAIQYDPDRFKDPERFDPTRFVDDKLSTYEGMVSSDPELRDHYGYGAGRRGCPGIHVAQNSLFILVSRAMWGFNVSKSRGPDGNIIEPENASEPGFVVTPKRFPCHLSPRSEKHARIIDQTWKEAEEEGCHWSRKLAKTLSL